ncbi:MAG TPA: carbamoyltransferase N-terminal domain-containing protein [bacterium]|nr:carbamoyltransferase N-terminal domain-containing protein [bacterium]
MRILGVSCYYHDAAAALLIDGQLVAAAEEERFSRRKHDSGFPDHAIDFCLAAGGLRGEDLDYVVFYEKPFLKFERILLTLLQTFPRSADAFQAAMGSWFHDKLWIRGQLAGKLGIGASRLLFVEHHASHAASAFFASPFREAAFITVDGVGEWATAMVGRASADWDGSGENRLDVLTEMRFPHSLGLLYSVFTAYLGFEVNEGEYKVMGMAPFGEPAYVDKVSQLIDVAGDGSFRLNMDYFAFHRSTDQVFTNRFVRLFGPPRAPESAFVPGQGDSRRFADIAASIQHVTEDVLLRMARYAHEQTGLRRLCLAGGVALNSVANGRIMRETPFDEVFIQPAAGDSGGALGAALYAHHVLLGQPRKFVMEHAYWGAGYTDGDIDAALARQGVSAHRANNEDELLDRTVDALVQGKVLGWFQGRFEWGPRALGNRSILADPRRPEMKDLVNAKVKFREPFRPFAPVVPEEDAGTFMDASGLRDQYPWRFMLAVAPVAARQRDIIPATTHVDGTGRFQVIQRQWNPLYYDLVRRFGAATGVPVLLNTSFNLRGEPIVNSPDDALATFRRSGLDMLVMGSHLVSKPGA